MEQESEAIARDRVQLAQRSSFATLGVLLSRLSGIFRTQVVNAVFGASTRLDAFNVALRFPSVLRDLFAEGALSAAFTKEIVTAQSQGDQELRQLVAVVTGFFLCVTLSISTAGWWFAEILIESVTSLSFQERGGFELAVTCFRILVFYLPIAMISALAMSLLGTRGQTFRATIASAFFNVGTIGGAVSGGVLNSFLGWDPIVGLAVGTLLGGLLQFAYQVLPLVRAGLFPFPSFRPSDYLRCPPLRAILKMMGPRAMSQGSLTLALFINTHFATAAGEGAVTFITNAQVIILVPVGLFGVAASFASLPLLSRAVQERDAGRMGTLLSDSLQSAVWMSWVSLFAFALMGVPFCVALLEHGRMTPSDSVQNAVAVCVYAIGMVFNSGSKVLMQGFYAFNDVRRSMFNATIYLLINATLSALLAPRFGIVGLGISNSLAAASDFILNWYFLNRVAARNEMPLSSLHGPDGQRLRKQLLCLGGAAFGLGVVGFMLARTVWLSESLLWQILPLGRFAISLLWLVALGVVWATMSVALIWFVGPKNLKVLLQRMADRLLRSKGRR